MFCVQSPILVSLIAVAVVALCALLWNFRYVYVELQWHSAPRLVVACTCLLYALVFHAWQKNKNGNW